MGSLGRWKLFPEKPRRRTRSKRWRWVQARKCINPLVYPDPITEPVSQVPSHALLCDIIDYAAMGCAMRAIAEWLASIGLEKNAKRFPKNAIAFSFISYS